MDKKGLPKWCKLLLITKLPKNMKSRLILMVDKILLRKRAVIKTINEPAADLAWKRTVAFLHSSFFS